MSDSGKHEKLTLARRLRRDARTSRPAFSDELHERMCRAVWPSQTDTIMAFRVASPRGRAGKWLAAAAAAACVLIMAGIAWRAGLLSSQSAAPVETVVAQNEAAAAMPMPAVESAPLPAAAEAVEPAADFENVTALVDETAGQLNELVASAIGAPRLVYLNLDAHLSVEGLAEHLPFELPFALASAESLEEGEP